MLALDVGATFANIADKSPSLKELPTFPNNAHKSGRLYWSLPFHILCSKLIKDLVINYTTRDMVV